MNVEKAYNLLAEFLVRKIDCNDWDKLTLDLDIGDESVGIECWRYFGSDKDQGHGSIPFSIKKAAFFLRDDLEHSTGARPWTLTFTLFPDYKFKLDYGYDKPEWLKK